MTMGQAVALMWSLLLLYGLLCGGITLLISAWTRSSVAALTAPALLVLMQMMRIPFPVWMGEYMPNQMFDSMSTLSDVRLLRLFGVTLNKLQFGFLLYGLLTILLLSLCWLGWRRSAEGRSH